MEGELEVFAAHMRHGLLAAAINVGLDVFSQLLAAEVTEVAGAKGRRDPARRAVRHGIERSKVPLGVTYGTTATQPWRASTSMGLSTGPGPRFGGVGGAGHELGAGGPTPS